MKTFSDRLRSAIAQKGDGKGEIAQDVGIHAVSLSRYLKGRVPDYPTAVKLAARLNISVKWLLDGEGPMHLDERQAALAKARQEGGVKLEENAASWKPSENPLQAEVKSQLNTYMPPGAELVRWIPVVSWAHAGTATVYEELPLDWQDLVPVPKLNGRAFGLRIQGDSMEPRCLNGDIVIVLPDEQAVTGNLVVVKLKSDGIMLRRFSLLSNGRIRLTAYNDAYPPADYDLTEFHWIYPVHSTMRLER